MQFCCEPIIDASDHFPKHPLANLYNLTFIDVHSTLQNLYFIDFFKYPTDLLIVQPSRTSCCYYLHCKLNWISLNFHDPLKC